VSHHVPSHASLNHSAALRREKRRRAESIERAALEGRELAVELQWPAEQRRRGLPSTIVPCSKVEA